MRANGELSVAELSAALEVAPATIRRDLHRLARSNQLVRTHGGAILPGATRTDSLDSRWKGLIAAEASRLIRDGQTIVIGSGSTTLELARRLVGRRLTVITNSLDVAHVLMDQPDIELIVLGGVMRPRMHSLLGHLTNMSAHELRADALFMGIAAVTLDGLLNDYLPEILTDRALREMVDNVIVLADSTKFSLMAPAVVFGLAEVSTIVTDGRIEPAVVGMFEQRGVHVILAEGNQSGHASPSTTEPAEGPHRG